jgi:hypothetical protein
MAEVRELVVILICGTIMLLPASASSQSTAETLSPQPAFSRTTSSPIDRWMPLIAKASKRFSVPVVWIRAVMRVESDGQTMQNGVPITSVAGAMGLMQVMPDTYADMKARYGLGADPYNPQDNIMAGAAFLREMYMRYGYPDLFAAYNAGPARFDQYLYDSAPLPAETIAYLKELGQLQFATPQLGDSTVANVGNFSEKSAASDDKMTSASAFEAPGMASLKPSSQGLFVALQTQSSDQP